MLGILLRRVSPVLVLIAAATTPVAAQQVAGQVVLEGWGEPLAAATVLLMDEQLAPVDSVATAADGTYVMALPGPGTYLLQARHGTSFGPVSAPLELDDDDRIDDLVLELPSPLYRAALDCFAERVTEGTGVLAGVVVDPTTEMPLPSARIMLEWDADGARRSRELFASEAGRFVACAVPAGVALTARVSTLGAISPSHPGIVVEERTVARHDLSLDLRGTGARVQVVTETGTRDVEGLSRVSGQLLDSDTGSPIPAARVALAGRSGALVSGSDGRFRFDDLAPGSYTLEVEHLGYGQQSETFEVPASSDVSVQIRVAARAIELEAITVRARREAMPARMAGATPRRTLVGPALIDHQRRGSPVSETLYDLPGIRLRYARDGGQGDMRVCAEVARGQFSVSGACNMMEVFVDGISVSQETAEQLLLGSVADYERIEYLPPMDAMRWGLRASEAGALFLWTARGRAPDLERD